MFFKKQIHHCFQPQYKSFIHNIAYSSEKVISSESGEKSQIKYCLQVKVVQRYGSGFWYLDSHFDGTHSQQRIHWWASDVMLNIAKYLLNNLML